jgi:hypothetical protein
MLTIRFAMLKPNNQQRIYQPEMKMKSMHAAVEHAQNAGTLPT